MKAKKKAAPKKAEQLAMFKTAGELRSEYDVWPGDREFNTRPNPKWSPGINDQKELPLGTKEEQSAAHWRNLEGAVSHSVMDRSGETAWNKKLEEAKTTSYRGAGYSFLPGKTTSLHEDIANKGVLSAVQIQTLADVKKPTKANPGVQEKPFITGGHHRIAAAADIDPNMLIPVEYHKSVKAAQRALGSKY